jgi:predicted SAM-dependent methyltransferase
MKKYIYRTKRILSKLLEYRRLLMLLERRCLIVGANTDGLEGFVSTNFPFLNIVNPTHWLFLCFKNKLDVVLAEHVWEHLTEEDGKIGVKNICKYLNKGGVLIIAVPDGFHTDSGYIEYVKVNGSGLGADDHKVLYNYKSLGALFQDAGLEFEFLEYFDEKGQLNVNKSDVHYNLIKRSFHSDKRNQDGRPNYTSLIIKGTKN